MSTKIGWLTKEGQLKKQQNKKHPYEKSSIRSFAFIHDG